LPDDGKIHSEEAFAPDMFIILIAAPLAPFVANQEKEPHHDDAKSIIQIAF